MIREKFSILLVIIGCLILCGHAQAGAEDIDVEYRERKNPRGEKYSEGTKKPYHAANHVNLIGAMLYKYVPLTGIPETLKLEYTLPYPADVHLLVQELYYSQDYRMYCLRPKHLLDQTKPIPPFEWTSDVIQELDKRDKTKKFNLYTLTAVARLNQEESGLHQDVAPVIFYRAANGLITDKLEYWFIFRPDRDIKLSSALYKQDMPNSGLVEKFLTNEKRYGEKWFFLRWNGASASAGYYLVKLTGYTLDTNRRIEQTVRFYHQP